MKRVGNSGNTNAAHLHFNVVDATLDGNSEGIPFTFDSFIVLGPTTPEPLLVMLRPRRRLRQ